MSVEWALAAAMAFFFLACDEPALAGPYIAAMIVLCAVNRKRG